MEPADGAGADQAEQKIFAISQEKPSKATPMCRDPHPDFEEIEAIPGHLGGQHPGELLRPGCDDPGPAAQRPDHRGRPAGHGQNLDRAEPGQERGPVARPARMPVFPGDEQGAAHLSPALHGGGHRSGAAAPAGFSRRNGHCWARASTAWGNCRSSSTTNPTWCAGDALACRRLMAEQGKELGLVMIDYLQLMERSDPTTECRSCRASPGA